MDSLPQLETSSREWAGSPKVQRTALPYNTGHRDGRVRELGLTGMTSAYCSVLISDIPVQYYGAPRRIGQPDEAPDRTAEE